MTRMKNPGGSAIGRGFHHVAWYHQRKYAFCRLERRSPQTGVSHTIMDPFYVGNMDMAVVQLMVKLLSLGCHFNCAPWAEITIGQGLTTALAPVGVAPPDIVYCLFEVKR